MTKTFLRMFWWSYVMKFALILMRLGPKMAERGNKLFSRSMLKWTSAFMALPPKIRDNGIDHMAKIIVGEDSTEK